MMNDHPLSITHITTSKNLFIMKNLKSLFTVAIFMALFSLQTMANPITPSANDLYAPLTAVRGEVSKVLQTTSFSDLGIDYAEVLLKFKVNHRGQVVILEMNSESTELIDLVQQKLDHYRIGTDVSVPVDMIYHVKLKFEMK